MVTIKQWKNYFLFTVTALLMLLLSITIFQVLPSGGNSSAQNLYWIAMQARTIAVDGENSYTLGKAGRGIGGFGMVIMYYNSSSNEPNIGVGDYNTSSSMTTTIGLPSSDETEQYGDIGNTLNTILLTHFIFPDLSTITISGSIYCNTYNGSLGLVFGVACNKTFNGRNYVFTGLSRYYINNAFNNTEATTIIPAGGDIFSGDNYAELYVSSNGNIYSSMSNFVNELKNSNTYLGFFYNVVYRAQYNISYSDGTSDTFLAGVSKSLKAAPSNAPAGHHASGWKDSDTGEVLGTSISTSQANKDYNLEPNYIPNSYIFQYNTDGGTISSEQVEGIKYNTQYTFPAATKDGYTLTGWKCQANGITYKPNTAYTVPNFGGDGTKIDFDAVWAANTYTVTFDDQGGVTNFVDLANTRNGTVTVSGSTYTLTVSGL